MEARVDYKTTVKFTTGESVEQLIVTTSIASAKRAARKLAIARIPYAGTPISVKVELVR